MQNRKQEGRQPRTKRGTPPIGSILSASFLEILMIYMLIGIVLFLIACWGLKSNPLEGHPADFAIYRVAAEILKAGNASRLYDLETQKEVFHGIPGNEHTKFIVWNHHPAEAILYLPAAWISYSSGLKIARWLNVAFMLIFVFWVAAKLRHGTEDHLLLVLILSLSSPFFASAISLGQDSIWICFLIVVGLMAAAEGKLERAGCLLGLASIKFTILLPLLAILAISGFQRRITAIAATVAFLLAILPAFLHPAIIPSYVMLCLDLVCTDRALGLYSEFLRSFRALALKWTGDSALSIATTAGFGFLYALALRWIRPQRILGLAFLGATLFSPHVYPHDGVMYFGSAVVILLARRSLRVEREQSSRSSP